MNPYESPRTADDRTPEQRGRNLTVAVAFSVAALMIVGGMVTFFMMRVLATRAMQAELIRARQAAEVAELRAREAASKAESERNPSPRECRHLATPATTTEAGGKRMTERANVETRTVHAIRIQLHSMADRSVIIWLKDTSKLCVQLMNPRRTWMTARAGDPVILNINDAKSREHIESIELYRVFPTACNGQTVESAWTWTETGVTTRGRPAVS